MTNMPSGSKRTWNGEEESRKRPRERDDARDWRDVHLRTSRQRSPLRRRDTIDRRDDRRLRDDYRARSRDYDRRPGDHGRERDRRDDRDKERETDRAMSRDHHVQRDDRRDERRDRRDDHAHNRRSRSPSRSKGRQLETPSHGDSAAPDEQSEKEEGEISPRPNRGPSPVVVGQRNTARPASSPTQQKQEHNKSSPEPAIDLELPPSPTPEEKLAARRAKRQAILAKYAGIASITTSQTASPSPGPSSAVEPPPASASESNLASRSQSILPTLEAADIKHSNGIVKRNSVSVSPTPAAFSLGKEGEEQDVQAEAQAENGTHEQISAADYDPSLDRREDEHRRVYGMKEEAVNTIEEEEIEEEEEDIDDIFAAVTSDKKVKKVKKVLKPAAAPALITTTLDSAADPEGYYSVILGEQLDSGRYQVYSHLGKGMFANVVRARVLQGDASETSKDVAIKIIRAQESMYRAGMKEVQILNKLRQADPEDKKHIVHLERTFEHRGHLCLVFENLSMNLRDVVKKFGKDVGLNIKAVRAYAHQLFLALSHLKKCNIMHADIKPDNILANEAKTVLKLCDLGSASDASENDITPYLVSRFYRAPEIIMGFPYDPALDVWSVGCTLYELYTGKILFPGRSNNHMLLLMMELKGRFNTRMIKKAKFGDMYFDELGGFHSIEQDRVSGANVMKTVHITKPSRDLRQRLMPHSSVKLKDEEAKLLTSFVDLLDKCLTLDPAKRITPKEALVHPFIRG